MLFLKDLKHTVSLAFLITYQPVYTPRGILATDLYLKTISVTKQHCNVEVL